MRPPRGLSSSDMRKNEMDTTIGRTRSRAACFICFGINRARVGWTYKIQRVKEKGACGWGYACQSLLTRDKHVVNAPGRSKSMKRFDGSLKSPIWLLADSNPVKGQKHIDLPLDSRFPTRHIIWTPVLDVVQRHIFLHCVNRLDDRNLYIRNAIENPADKRDEQKLNCETKELRELLNDNHPPIVLCFGQFAFEFARRAWHNGEEARYPFRYWTVERLAKEFTTRISKISPDSVTLLPLLHVIVAKQFPHCHRLFSDCRTNYYEYVGEEIARVLLQHRSHRRLKHLWL